MREPEQLRRDQPRTPELERAVEELRRAQDVLSQAATVAHLGAWWIDVSNGDDLDANPLRWSDEVYRIFGYEPREVEVSNALFFSHVHPDDRERVARAIRGALAGRRPYTIQHRIVLRGGEERVIVERADGRYDDAGKLVLVIGAVQDVTEQIRTQEALRLSEERARRQLAEIEAIYATAPVGLCVFDRELRWVRLNEQIAEINGVPVEAHIGKTPREVVPDVGQQAEAALRNILETGEALLDFEMSGTTAAQPGVQRFWNERWAPIKDDGGRIIGITVAAEEISERKRAEAALRAANEQLREADRRKDEFLGMLSHELRNPLAPIRNSVYVLRHADPGGDQARRARDVIERQTEHLARLVDDLLDVTRIAKGMIELRRRRADLRELVRHAAYDFEPAMEARGIAFRAVLPEVKIWTNADATRIAQIIGNLLHNAAKFTRRGDEVTLSLTPVDGQAEIRVRDTGAGINPEFLPRVFDAFAQGERTLARSNGGLGLGLALVKEIAELHGGTVRAESGGTGRGAEFVVRLPLIPDPVEEPAGEGRPVRGIGGRRVLVVDDNADSAESLAEILAMLGNRVDVAYDGPSAVEKARENRPDVVLCDVGLPGMSGYDVAKALRAAGYPMQLFALSGYAQPEDVRSAVEAGFDGHLAKPARIEDIERLLA